MEQKREKKPLGINEARTAFLSFLKARKHAIISSAPIIPENDPTTLFTSSGMQPLVPYLLGEPHPAGARLANAQKCFRAEDIDEVGDNRHTTFFEMLGNWSLGDYFKREQIEQVFSFLVDCIGINPERLYVTAFMGDAETKVPKDTEAVEIWKRVFSAKGIDAKDVELVSEEEGGKRGMQGGRIFYYNAKKNWWSRAGVPSAMNAGEPGGPDTEIFYEFTHIEHDAKFGAHCHPNCDCGRFMEIGNSVFMAYQKQNDGSFLPLKQKNVDFGGGLERIVAAAMNTNDVFQIDIFKQIIGILEAASASGKKYGESEEITRAFRIVADHIRAALFIMSDGVVPSKSGAGSLLRKLIRRSVFYVERKLDIDAATALPKLCAPIIDLYKDAYPRFGEHARTIGDLIAKEVGEFQEALRKAEAPLREACEIAKKTNSVIDGETTCALLTTHGLYPLELLKELAAVQGCGIDEKGFEIAFEKHREISKAGAEKKFKGGLADTSAVTVKYHTATHLLQAALRKVLGEHVFQKGSNITAERLRFDFVHPTKMTDEEKQRVEDMVNEQIKKSLPVSFEDMTVAEAKERGALGVFEDRYGEKVHVYQIGDATTGIFSMEICGGPHVQNTSELGHFKIQKEEASSSGVRRIKAVLE